MIDERPPAGDRLILFRSGALLARADLGRGGDLCFVVFDPMVEDRSLERVAFGERFLAGHGVDAIHILSARNGWYQEPDLPAVLAAVRAVTGHYARVVTYGSSMGGYAALRFARAVGATMAIAISPQYSVLPATAAFETRWTEERDAVAWLHERPGDRLPPVAEAVVFYDDRWLDGRHAALIRRDLPHVTAVAMPYAGHPAGTILADAGVLAETILDAAHGRLDRARLLAALRRHRHRSGQFLQTLAHRQPVWRLRLKARLALRACDLAPSEPSVLSYAGLAHECIGEGERALALHEEATRPPSPGYAELRRARALWRAGRRGEARAAFDRALGSPSLSGFAALHEVGARMAIADGAYGEGFARLIAIARAPAMSRRSVLARIVAGLRWGPALRSAALRALVRRIAIGDMRGTVMNPDNILNELAEADSH